MKKIIIAVFFIYSLSSFGSTKDSTKIADLSVKIQNTIKENEILKVKVDVLNEANNKIIAATYTLLGIILLIGGWNSIQSYKINNEKLKNIEKSVENRIYDKIDIKIKVDSENQNHKIAYITNQIKNVNLKIKILLAKMCCTAVDSKSYKDGNFAECNLFELLELSVEYYNNSRNYEEIKESIQYLIDYYTKNTETEYWDKYYVEKIRTKISSIEITEIQNLKDKLISKLK